MSEFGPQFDRAQERHDAQEPPEDWDCEEDGHQWQILAGEAKDGTRLAKCKKCGQTVEV